MRQNQSLPMNIRALIFVVLITLLTLALACGKEDKPRDIPTGPALELSGHFIFDSVYIAEIEEYTNFNDMETVEGRIWGDRLGWYWFVEAEVVNAIDRSIGLTQLRLIPQVNMVPFGDFKSTECFQRDLVTPIEFPRELASHDTLRTWMKFNFPITRETWELFSELPSGQFYSAEQIVTEYLIRRPREMSGDYPSQLEILFQLEFLPGIIPDAEVGTFLRVVAQMRSGVLLSGQIPL